MLRLSVIRIGFIMGISMLLGAIIYFFAANWGGLDRMEKIVSAAGILVLFYGASFTLTKIKAFGGHRAFLSAIFLVGGCISFGAATALLNQIYNAHVDSYELFLVWAIPALALAWITRYSPFYVLSYILVHLTAWFLFFPSSLYVEYSNKQHIMIAAFFAIINLLLFIITAANRLASPPLKVLSFIVFHISLLSLTNSFAYGNFGIAMNIVCAAAIGAGFFIFSRVKRDKTILALNALAASAFAVFKFIELASEYASIMFFVYGLLFVTLLLTANVFFFRYLNKLGDKTASLDAPDKEVTAKVDKNHIAGKIVAAIVTIIGIVIGSISLFGLVLLASGGIEPQFMLFALSLLLVIPVLLLPRVNAVVRYTVLAIGFAAGLISIAWIEHIVISCLFILLAATSWISLKGRKQRFFIYALLQIHIIILLNQLIDLTSSSNEFTIIIFTLTLLNAAAYACHLGIKEPMLQQQIRESGLFFTLLFLFCLTFADDWFPYSYELFNVVFFAAATICVFAYLRRSQALEASIGIVFWFAFFVCKYYDLLWTLLHKSITLALLGLIFLAVTAFIARKLDTPDDSHAYRFLHARSQILICIVIVLQLGYIGYHAATSEYVLRNGTSIKLQIEPLDPRSLLQGDYVTLNYSISTLPDGTAEQIESRRSFKQVKVVLTPDDRGVYSFKRLYSSEQPLTSGEVVVNGTHSGWNTIHYGIESYFVPEGTGTTVEQNARFAYVRVSANGNMLLEKLSGD